MNTARVIQLPCRNSSGIPAPVLPDLPESLETRGAFLWDRADVEAAARIWQEILGRDPSRSDIRLRLARAVLLTGAWDEAADELTICLPLYPDQPDLLVHLAICCLHRNQNPQALGLLDQALRLDPQHRLAHAALGATRSSHPEIAADSSRMEWQMPSPAPPSLESASLFEEAIAALEQGRPSEARTLLSDLLLLDPDHAPALFELAQIEEAENRLPWARRYYEAAIRAWPQAWEPHYNLARLLFSEGQDEEARLQLERAVLLEPESAGAAWLLAQTCERLGDDAEARFFYSRAEALDPRNPEVCCALARLALLRGQTDEAESWLDKACALDRSRYDVLYHLGLCRWRQGDSSTATALWRSAVHEHPGRPEAAQALAACALAGGHLEECVALLDAHPTAELHWQAAEAFSARGDSPRALRHYRRALALKPSLAAWYFA